MNISKKLAVLCGLGVVFAIVLAMIYLLVAERVDYASAVLDLRASGPDSSINDYRMIARSIKYGMLLVAFTFTVFFLYEVLQDWRIHPMQYLLVGAALSVFYLLLLSFAEQIGFVPAYVIAAVACIGLIVWYLRFVLDKGRAVLLMGALLVVGYVVMFVLLRLPTYNLLLGSLLLFVALFAVMYLTRNIDWYALGESNSGVCDESEQY
ncbi:cell envelope integrity protein CreD [Cardiobacteriaceae bacterium TAE3-ERU3]|nr:cell envelope integrity protein CreD [Cardiobacteriaceae bacterium TAE3-ERU3]